MDLRMVKLGVNVNIQRSDGMTQYMQASVDPITSCVFTLVRPCPTGRVHLAAITSIDLERKVVAVEWYEGGETKGKEVECDVILQLNPNLRKPLSSRSVNSRSAANRERSASASSRKKEDRRTICTPAKVFVVHTSSVIPLPNPTPISLSLLSMHVL